MKCREEGKEHYERYYPKEDDEGGISAIMTNGMGVRCTLHWKLC